MPPQWHTKDVFRPFIHIVLDVPGWCGLEDDKLIHIFAIQMSVVARDQKYDPVAKSIDGKCKDQ